MGSDHSDQSTNLLFLSGLYSRVARQLGVHPSYVSRVARGERRSDRVYRAIAAELAKLRGPALSEEPDSEITDSKLSAIRELRQRLTKKFLSEPRLRRLNAVIIDADATDSRPRQAVPRRVPPSNLSTRIAANARLMAACVVSFEKFSRKLEHFHHVLSLLDADGIVLYSTGTTGMARREHRLPGVDWSRDFKGGLSSAARAIAAGVPVVVIGSLDLHGTFVPSAKIASPVKLSGNEVVGALNLTIEISRARPEYLIELCKLSRKVCSFVENGPIRSPKKRDRESRVRPFEDAAGYVAGVLSLPQLDARTRMDLSGLLSELENTRRDLLLTRTQSKPRSRGRSVRAQGAG